MGWTTNLNWWTPDFWTINTIFGGPWWRFSKFPPSLQKAPVVSCRFPEKRWWWDECGTSWPPWITSLRWWYGDLGVGNFKKKNKVTCSFCDTGAYYDNQLSHVCFCFYLYWYIYIYNIHILYITFIHIKKKHGKSFWNYLWFDISLFNYFFRWFLSYWLPSRLPVQINQHRAMPRWEWFRLAAVSTCPPNSFHPLGIQSPENGTLR